MHYDIELLGKEVKNNFVTFQNFRIKGVSSWTNHKQLNNLTIISSF
jgi:hypothetical protein